MTAAQVELLVLVPVAYVVGSIPFGLLVGLARGVDVRTAGSGNIGATNVGRLLGGKFFALVFILDVGKGLAPMLAAGAALRFRADDWGSYLLWILVGFAAILGHMCSLFLKFAGGKGVATSTGVVLGLFPYLTLPVLVAVAAFGAAFAATGYVSVGSIVGAIALPAAYLAIGLMWRPPWPVFGEQWPLLLFSLLVAAMIVYKHRGNIARLRAGTEHRAGSRASRIAARPGANGSNGSNGSNGDAVTGNE